MRPLLFQRGVGGAAAAVARLGCTPDLTPEGLMDGGVLGERLRTIGKPSEPCVPVSPRTQRKEHSYGQMSRLTLSHHTDRPPAPTSPTSRGCFQVKEATETTTKRRFQRPLAPAGSRIPEAPFGTLTVLIETLLNCSRRKHLNMRMRKMETFNV